MAEQEAKASHEEVEGFVGKLKDFYGSLDESEQAMLQTILTSAQGETGGYSLRRPSGEEAEQIWNDLIRWIEDLGGEDTQGFKRMPGR